MIVSVKNTDAEEVKAYRFNLRIEIQEKPKGTSVQFKKDILPKSIEEITRYKLKNEGMKEADFLITSATTLAFIDENKLHPFTRKSNSVY